MESLEGVDRWLMNGVRATLVLTDGADLTEGEVRLALAAQGLEFGSLERHAMARPGSAFVAATPGAT